MAKATNEELQKELEDVVAKHNEAVEFIAKCKRCMESCTNSR